MRRILVFGDSNTWGYRPDNAPGKPPRRYDDAVRWTGVLGALLGDGYCVLNEGLNGRTTVWDDPIDPYRRGRDHIVPLLETHAPFDLLIVMLGTNDLKQRFGATARDIAGGAQVLAEMALARAWVFVGNQPRVLLICPPPLGPIEPDSSFSGGGEKSRRLAPHFRVVARESGVDWLDAGEFVASAEADGVHLTPEAHRALGEAVARKVKEMLG